MGSIMSIDADVLVPSSLRKGLMSYMKHSELMTGELGCYTETYYNSTDCTEEYDSVWSFPVHTDASSATCYEYYSSQASSASFYCNEQEGSVTNYYSNPGCEGEPIHTYNIPVGTCIEKYGATSAMISCTASPCSSMEPAMEP